MNLSQNCANSPSRPGPLYTPSRTHFGAIPKPVQIRVQTPVQFGFSDLQTQVINAMVLQGHKGSEEAVSIATRRIMERLKDLQPHQAQDEALMGTEHGNILMSLLLEKGDVEGIQRCLDLGFTLNYRDGFGENRLMVAIKSKKPEAIQQVLSHLEKTLSPEDFQAMLKETATEGTNRGKTALEVAYKSGDSSVIKLLRPHYQVGFKQHLKLKFQSLF